jgi:PD-(D/E)XK nuclease superfamily
MAASRYYVDGKRVPGCTSSVVGQLGWNTQALKWWAFRTARMGARIVETAEGPEIRYEFQELNDYTVPADVGTFAHAAVEADLKGITIDLTRVPTDQLRQVEAIVERWKAWRATRIAEVLVSEEELVSERLRFGGRPDMVFRAPDGTTWLLDLKTGGIYAEHLVQVAAYAMLVEEAKGIEIDTLAILRIPRDGAGITTVERPWNPDSEEAEAVRICRRLYDIHKRLDAEV